MKKLLLSVVALMASVTLWAQDLPALYNEGVAAFQKKDFTTAIAKFAEVVELGEEAEEAEELVGNAGKNLAMCYYRMAGGMAQQKKFTESLDMCEKGLEVAKDYNKAYTAKFNGMKSKVYIVLGGEKINAKDFAGAVEFLEKGVECSPRNVKLQNMLAMSYCESGKFVEGMEVYEQVAKNDNPKYAAEVEQAKKDMALYTNNEIAKLQAAQDFDGMLAMAESLLEKNAESALGLSIRVQAYNGKKDFAKVLELGEAAAAAQVDDEGKSAIYFIIGCVYNEQKQPEKAIAAFSKVTAGPNVQNAQAAIAGLKK